MRGEPQVKILIKCEHHRNLADPPWANQHCPTIAGVGHYLACVTKMRHFIRPFVLLSLLSFFLGAHAGPTEGIDKFLSRSGHTNNWAVLVSTSRFWFNYRVLPPVSVIDETRPKSVAYCKHSVDVSYRKAPRHSGLSNHPHARG